MNDRKRGIVGKRIPASHLTPIVRAVLGAMNGVHPESLTGVDVSMDCLLISRTVENEEHHTQYTEYALVNTEGVGSTRVPSTNAINVWAEQAFWGFKVQVGIPMLEGFANSGEEVDLADHIRTFGGRLDSNHYRWVRWVEKGDEE